MENNITEPGKDTGINNVVRQIIFILSAMISVSTVWSPYMISPLLSAALCCVCGTLAGIVCVLAKSTGTRLPVRSAVLFMLMLCCAVFFRSFIAGLAETANVFINLINSQFNTEFVLIKSSGATFFDNLIFILIINSASAVFMELCTSRRRYALVIIYLFINYKISLMLSVTYSFTAVLAITSSFGVCWSIGNNYRGSGSSNAVFVAALIGICTVISFGMFGSFRGSEQVMHTRESIADTFHTARYGSDLLPDGDMTKASDMHDDDKVRLNVTAQRPISGNMYLYGYVGAEYDGYSSWKKYSTHEDDEWNGIFKWLDESSFVPQLRYSNAFSDTPSVRVDVANKGADRSFVYVPFSLRQIDGKYKFKHDLSVSGKGLFGTKNYSFTYGAESSYEDVLVEYSVGKNNADESDADSVYNAYVEATYLKIDDETKQQMNDAFFNTDALTEDSGIYSVISRIRTVMELRSTYSANPDAYNGKESFVTWFLENQRAADSPYYATVAALALRAAGYPARYAEGYYIAMNGNSEAEARSDSGHAWCEVYLNNIGWIPVEFTPGYYQQSLLNKVTVELSSNNVSGGRQSDDKYQMTEEYNDTAGEDEPENSKDGLTMHRDIMIKLIGLAAAAVIFVVFMFVRDIIKRRQRKKVLRSDTPERYLYSAVMKIIRLGGVECDETRPLDCADKLAEVFKGIRREEYERMIFIMQKSVFGQKKLEKREIYSLMSFYSKIRKMLYKQSKRFKKLKLRFINNV